MKQCILVASASEARILTRNDLGPVKEKERLEHPENRLHAGDLEEQGGGAQHESNKTDMRQTDPRTETAEKYAERFADRVAQRLRELRNDHAMDELLIAAEPRFLGHLRQKLDSATEGRISRTVDKDYTSASVDTIHKKLLM